MYRVTEILNRMFMKKIIYVTPGKYDFPTKLSTDQSGKMNTCEHMKQIHRRTTTTTQPYEQKQVIDTYRRRRIASFPSSTLSRLGDPLRVYASILLLPISSTS
jgi:hypothetical protein